MTTAKIEVEIEIDGRFCEPNCRLMACNDYGGDCKCVLDGRLLETDKQAGKLAYLRCDRCKDSEVK